MSHTFVMASLLLLASCAADPVLDIGEGRHSLTGESALTLGKARADGLEQANDYCGREHKAAVVVSFADAGVDVYGRYHTSLIFTCG